jgi:uroporphyrinogen decarboxylase
MDVSPSVYEHAAQFLGMTPWEVSRDGDLVARAHAAAYECYRHTPIMPGIDIYNLEAEAYGATITPPAGIGIPGIEKPPYESTGDLLRLDPLEPAAAGRIPMLLEASTWLARQFPEANIRVPVSGPFSIASNLVGFNNLLLEAATEPEMVASALMHLVEGQVRFAGAIKQAGLDVAFFESAACPPMLSPTQFRELELPALTQSMSRIGQIVGHPIPCIIGGNTCPILDAMLETGTGYLACPFETDQAAFMAGVQDCPSVRIRVNMDLRIVASGTTDEVEREADRVLEIIGARPNCCIGTGALPYETNPENVLHLMKYVERVCEA